MIVKFVSKENIDCKCKKIVVGEFFCHLKVFCLFLTKYDDYLFLYINNLEKLLLK